MKILWLVNVPMPRAAQAMGFRQMNTGGWLSGQLDMLAGGDTKMVVCHVTELLQTQKAVEVDGVCYVFLPSCTKQLRTDFERLLQDEQPDVVHIFGTEYAHSEAMVEACGGERCVISLQGVMTEYAKHYKDGLPQNQFNRVAPLKRLVKKLYYAECIAQGEEEFFARAQCEAAMLKKMRHVIGRTHWDKACAQQLCPQAAYHTVNENLRAEFYGGDIWSPAACTRHTLFVSQALYPIKGFHQVLAALPQLLQAYPDIQVFVGGVKPYTLGNRVLDIGVDYFFEYQKYLKQMMRCLGLEGHVTYTGPLNAAQMKAQYLASHVFLSPSSIENSPNSVGEAMMLGAPIVSSNVGGVASMLRDGSEGLLYDFHDTQAMVQSIARVLDDDALALSLGQNARAHALKTHDRQNNTRALLAVYREIQREGGAQRCAAGGNAAQ